MGSSSQHTIRSISLPSRSHPATKIIEEELNKVKTSRGSSPATPTSKTIASGVSRLVDLYESMDDLLAQKPVHYRQHERCVDDLQGGFMSLLEICGTARDVVSLLKGNCRDIQSCLRRRKGLGSEIESIISNYISSRKKMIKLSKKQKAAFHGSAPLLELDDHLVSAVIRALREVVTESFSVLHTLLLFFHVPVLKPKQMRRSLVSKLLQSEVCEDVNELQHMDIALQVLCRSEASGGDNRVNAAQNSLRSLEGNIESIEHGLECLFRGLIKARASLLNIVSD